MVTLIQQLLSKRLPVSKDKSKRGIKEKKIDDLSNILSTYPVVEALSYR